MQRFNKEFKINISLIECMKEKNINPILLLKSTIHFIVIIDNEFEDIENIILNLIDEYKIHTTKTLTSEYKRISTFLTKNQKRIYDKISYNNKSFVINNLISIAINNNNYTNHTFEKIVISEDITFNKFTVNFFTAFIYDETYFRDRIIILMKSILYKFNDIMKKQILNEIYYKNLYFDLLKKEYALEYLKSPKILEFHNLEFGKLFFSMIHLYDINLKNESKNIRNWKSKFNKILINKYDNNIMKFIYNELNVYKKELSVNDQVKESLNFIGELHPTIKEKKLVAELIFRFMQINDLSDS